MIDWIIYGILGTVFTGCVVMALKSRKKEPVVCRLSGLEWTQEELCHGTMITGAIGSGKSCALLNFVDQIFQNSPNFGGLWLDAKGSSHVDLLRIAKRHGREKDVIILEVPFEGRTAYPQQTLNLMEAGGMGPEIVAEILAEISTQGQTDGKSAHFFRSQTVEHVSAGLRFLKHIKKPVNAKTLQNFLCNIYEMRDVLKSLGGRTEEGKDGRQMFIPDDNPWADHWWNSYLGQAPEQLSGVISSISNALACFTSGPVADVFSSDSTVDINDINNSKIICVTIPSIYPRQKDAVNQFMKSLFFSFGKLRFDRRKFSNQTENLLLCFLDEYQRCASVSDIRSMDVLRDSKCAFITACQDETSLIPVVGRDVQPVLVGKMRNRVIFAAESAASAQASADLIGKKRIWRNSYGSSGGKPSSNRSLVDDHIILPQYFSRLKGHKCVILHTNRSVKKNVKFPLM